MTISKIAKRNASTPSRFRAACAAPSNRLARQPPLVGANFGKIGEPPLILHLRQAKQCHLLAEELFSRVAQLRFSERPGPVSPEEAQIRQLRKARKPVANCA